MLHSHERIIVPVYLGSVSHLTLVNETTIVLRGDSPACFLVNVIIAQINLFHSEAVSTHVIGSVASSVTESIRI